MSKLWLVFKREYLVRVRKRSFILATILMPLAFAALAVGAGLITAMGAQATKHILVVDESGIFATSSTDRDNMDFDFSDRPIEQLASSYAEDGYDLLVHIPPFNDLSRRTHEISYLSKEKPSIVLLGRIESVISDAFREHKITASNIDRDLYESFSTEIQMESRAADAQSGGEKGSGKMAAMIGTALGFVMGILMYMVILIYGQMVMRSVMEEKISRIAEVMISSVRPFQLMMGKILGVGGVGLTQLAIWMVLIPVVLAIVPVFMPGVDPQSSMTMGNPEGMAAIQDIDQSGINLSGVISEFFRLNWVVIIPSFILFFLGGYFIYSSMFAAIGSSVDEDLGEAQQFMLPVMIPVIFAFLLMMATIENPNSPLSVFGSIFPLFSPIIMPARLPFDPPLWQVLLSLALLIGTTLLFIWLSARIYRIGILMYGKKVTFRELGRWMFYKG